MDLWQMWEPIPPESGMRGAQVVSDGVKFEVVAHSEDHWAIYLSVHGEVVPHDEIDITFPQLSNEEAIHVTFWYRTKYVVEQAAKSGAWFIWSYLHGHGPDA